MTILDDLIKTGFEPVTEWVLKGIRIGPKSFDWKDQSGWLYAFVVDGQVMYIGLTTRLLRERMSDYSHIRNSQTDHKRTLVLKALRNGRRVHVYGLKYPESATLGAEELRLRQLHRPVWNKDTF